MVVSKIQLSSNALIMLGANPISSFTEDSAEATIASNLYETSYLSILSSFDWNFAKKKATLARLSETPTNKYKYKFQIPSDLLRLITTYPISNYEILGDNLFTDSSTVDIDYIYKVTEDMFPAFFLKSFEYYLAVQFAIPITEDLNKIDVMQKLYEKESRRARFNDSQEQPTKAIDNKPYIDVRY